MSVNVKSHFLADEDGNGGDLLLQLTNASVQRRTPVDIMCVIDVSGSMGADATLNSLEGGNQRHNSLSLVLHSVKTVVHLLGPHDRIGLVSYDHNSRLVFPLLSVTPENIKDMVKAIEATSLGGSTNIWAGLKEALDHLKDSEATPVPAVEPATLGASGDLAGGRMSHVFLLSDGEPNCSPPAGEVETLKDYLVSTDFLRRPVVHTYSFGYGSSPTLMAALAQAGRGMFSFIPDATMVGTVFVNTLSTVVTTITTACEVTVKLPAGMAVVRKDVLTALEIGAPAYVKDSVGLDMEETEFGMRVEVGSLRLQQPRHVLLRVEKSTSTALSGAGGAGAGGNTPPVSFVKPAGEKLCDAFVVIKGLGGEGERLERQKVAVTWSDDAHLRDLVWVERARRTLVSALLNAWREVPERGRPTPAFEHAMVATAAAIKQMESKLSPSAAFVDSQGHSVSTLVTSVAGVANADATSLASVPAAEGGDVTMGLPDAAATPQPHPDASAPGRKKKGGKGVAKATPPTPAQPVVVEPSANGPTDEEMKMFGSLERNLTLLERMRGIYVDARGECTMAMEPTAWRKWGRAYVPSICFSHVLEAVTNFKDPGLQGYASAPFRALRDSGQAVFLGIECKPADTASRSAGYGGASHSSAVGMGATRGGGGATLVASAAPQAIGGSYWDISGGCVDARSRLRVWRSGAVGDGVAYPCGIPVTGEKTCFCACGQGCGWKDVAAKEVVVGDAVASVGGACSGVVGNVLDTFVGKQIAMCGVGALWITPWHPIRADASTSPWVFPNTVAEGGAGDDSKGKVEVTGGLKGVRMERFVDHMFTFVVQQTRRHSDVSGASVEVSSSRAASFSVEGVEVIALGHGVEGDDVATHPFFGTSAVVDAVEALKGGDGVARIASHQFVRGVDGVVAGIARPSNAVPQQVEVSGTVGASLESAAAVLRASASAN